MARVLFKVILYDAVVLWKYIQESKRSETDIISFLIHAGERRRRIISAFTNHDIPPFTTSGLCMPRQLRNILDEYYIAFYLSGE